MLSALFVQIDRHIGNDAHETKEMLETIGCTSLDQLIGQTVPDSIRSNPFTAFEHRGK